MELIDVLTPDGLPSGVRKFKSEVHRDGDWHRAAHVWIVTPEAEVLLQVRASTKENWPDRWDVSVGGHLSADESAVDAALRETIEELGLHLTREELRHIATVPESWVLNGGAYIDNEIHEVFLVRRAIDVAALAPDPEEVGGVALVTAADLRERVSRGDPSLVPHTAEYAILLPMLSAAGR